MKTFQDFSPYNGLYLVTKQLKVQKTVSVQNANFQRALNDYRQSIRVLSSETKFFFKVNYCKNELKQEF